MGVPFGPLAVNTALYVPGVTLLAVIFAVLEPGNEFKVLPEGYVTPKFPEGGVGVN